MDVKNLAVVLTPAICYESMQSSMIDSLPFEFIEILIRYYDEVFKSV